MRGKTLTLKGDVRAADDVTIDGTIEGDVTCEGHAVIIGPSGRVTGNVLAARISVLGRCNGQLTAPDLVEIRAGAVVAGTVIAKRFVLDLDATFNGRVEPQHLEAALSVARFRDKQQDTPRA
jgi:cytoskeletal protein CcmA (bactofilin family)